MCVCSWQLYAPVDWISSNAMMEAVSWAAGSATASETVPMDQTKSTAKTVCVCAALQMTLILILIILMPSWDEGASFFLFFVFLFLHSTLGCPEAHNLCVCVCQCKCFGSINGLYHFPDGFLQKEKHQNPPQVVFRYHSRVFRRRFYNNLMPSQSTSRCLNASFCVCVCSSWLFPGVCFCCISIQKGFKKWEVWQILTLNAEREIVVTVGYENWL